MIGIDLGVMRQFFIDCVDDMVQEIGFPQRVAAAAGIDDPVGCAGRQYFGLALYECREKSTSCPAVTGRAPADDALVHAAMVSMDDPIVEIRRDRRQQNGVAIEVQAEKEQPAAFEKPHHAG